MHKQAKLMIKENGFGVFMTPLSTEEMKNKECKFCELLKVYVQGRS